MAETVTVTNRPYEGPRAVIHDDQPLNRVARYAAQLILSWNLGGPPRHIGEGKADPAVSAIPEPHEVVARAFATAELFYAEVGARSAFIPAPLPAPKID